MSVRRSSRFAVRPAVALTVVVVLLTTVTGPAAAVGSGGPAIQAANETAATDGTDAGGNGSQLETAAGEGDEDGEAGLIGGVLGFVGGLFGGLFGLLGGVFGALAGFLDSTIGHALVGIPLGLYLGLKAIALYLEYYE